MKVCTNLSLFEKLMLLAKIWLLNFGIGKVIIAVKVIKADDEVKKIFEDAAMLGNIKARYKVAIDGSWQPRFLIGNTVYRLNAKYGLRNDKKLDIIAPAIADYLSRPVDDITNNGANYIQ